MENEKRTRKLTAAPLLDVLRGQIMSGHFPPGSRLPSTRALADELQISHATVGQFMRRLTAEGLVTAGTQRIRFVSPQVNQSESRLPADAVALISDLSVDHPVHAVFPYEQHVHVAIVNALMEAGLTPYFYGSGPDQLHQLARLRPAACIVLSVVPGPAETAVHEGLQTLTTAGIPLVLLGDAMSQAVYADVRGDRVHTDQRHGGGLLVHHLVECGFRRPAIVGLEYLKGDPLWWQERVAGIREAIAGHGLQAPPFVELPVLEIRGELAQRFARSVSMTEGFLRDLLASERKPDALMTSSDGEVQVVAAACRRLGSIPGRDLVITGYDDYWRRMPDQFLDPYRPFASVNCDGHAMGRAAVSVMLERRAGRFPAAPQVRRVPGRLVCGDEVVACLSRAK